jgi:outer membrane protein TolC
LSVVRGWRSAAGLLVVCFSLVLSPRAGAAELVGLLEDPRLAPLLEEAIAHNPGLEAVRQQQTASEHRIPPAGALPDPQLSLGYQNDGFTALTLGEMETSWISLMVSQSLPWPGNRPLLQDLARSNASGVGALLERERLGLEAEVRRSYVGLALATERLSLLSEQEGLWHRAEEVGRTRYEVGGGAQAELLRTQLELQRLKQRRWKLEAERVGWVGTLNRLLGRAPETLAPVVTAVEGLRPPVLPALDAAVADALARSPELQAARIAVVQAQQQVDLVRLSRFPDLNLSAGVMPRGALMPMWQVGVGVSLPVFAKQKQRPALHEAQSLLVATQQRALELQNLIQQRVRERHAQLSALLQTQALYREGLLVLSKASTESTLGQYAAGKASFSAILDGLNGYLADRDEFLLTLAACWELEIQAAEVSLAGASGPAPGPSRASMPSSSSSSPVFRAGEGGGGASPAPASSGMAM